VESSAPFKRDRSYENGGSAESSYFYVMEFVSRVYEIAAASAGIDKIEPYRSVVSFQTN